LVSSVVLVFLEDLHQDILLPPPVEKKVHETGTGDLGPLHVTVFFLGQGVHKALRKITRLFTKELRRLHGRVGRPIPLPFPFRAFEGDPRQVLGRNSFFAGEPTQRLGDLFRKYLG
jgi:hypothetical protein